MNRDKFLKDLAHLRKDDIDKIEDYDSFEKLLFSKEGLEGFFTEAVSIENAQNFPGILFPDKLSLSEKEVYSNKIKQTALKAIKTKRYKDSFVILKLGYKVNSSDTETLLMLFTTTLLIKAETECEKYFHELLNIIPTKEALVSIKELSMIGDITDKTVHYLSKRIDELISKKDYRNAIISCEIGLQIKPDDKELLSNFNTIPVPLVYLDGVRQHFKFDKNILSLILKKTGNLIVTFLGKIEKEITISKEDIFPDNLLLDYTNEEIEPVFHKSQNLDIFIIKGRSGTTLTITLK